MFVDRQLITAAFGIVCLLQSHQALGEITPENEPIYEESAPAGDLSGSEDDDQTIDLTPALDRINASIRELMAENDTKDDEQAQERESRDLDAQEAMALWAEYMFYSAAASVILTFLALVAIIRTLHHTRRAADYTQGMLDEAKETTRQARRSTDISEVQTLPIVEIQKPSLDIRNDSQSHSVSFVSRLRYSGGGVAYLSTFKTRMRIEASGNVVFTASEEKGEETIDGSAKSPVGAMFIDFSRAINETDFIKGFLAEDHFIAYVTINFKCQTAFGKNLMLEMECETDDFSISSVIRSMWDNGFGHQVPFTVKHSTREVS